MLQNLSETVPLLASAGTTVLEGMLVVRAVIVVGSAVANGGVVVVVGGIVSALAGAVVAGVAGAPLVATDVSGVRVAVIALPAAPHLRGCRQSRRRMNVDERSGKYVVWVLPASRV